jgi:hypothetical protein
MKSSWGGLLVGAIGLAVLDGVVSSQQASANVGGWVEGAGSLVNRFLNPTVPLFSTPAATTTAAPATTAAATTTTTTTTAPGAAVTTIPPATAVPITI